VEQEDFSFLELDSEPQSYVFPLFVETGAFSQASAAMRAKLDARIHATLLEHVSKRVGASEDEHGDSNPIYLLPADPNYAPTGPNGFFPNNWFNPVGAQGGSAGGSMSPPAPTEAQGPDTAGTVNPPGDTNTGGGGAPGSSAAGGDAAGDTTSSFFFKGLSYGSSPSPSNEPPASYQLGTLNSNPLGLPGGTTMMSGVQSSMLSQQFPSFRSQSSGSGAALANGGAFSINNFNGGFTLSPPAEYNRNHPIRYNPLTYEPQQ